MNNKIRNQKPLTKKNLQKMKMISIMIHIIIQKQIKIIHIQTIIEKIIHLIIIEVVLQIKNMFIVKLEKKLEKKLF